MIGTEGDDAAAGVGDGVNDSYQKSNRDSISRHREAEGSSDAAAEGDAGEGGAGEEKSVSTKGRDDLISGHVRTAALVIYWTVGRTVMGGRVSDVDLPFSALDHLV